jgi:hypothetical protein
MNSYHLDEYEQRRVALIQIFLLKTTRVMPCQRHLRKSVWPRYVLPPTMQQSELPRLKRKRKRE